MDRDKVIKGLEEAIRVIDVHVPERYWGYARQACCDAIAFLREQHEELVRLQRSKNWAPRVREKAMSADCCVICGEYVPEGRQVCPTCEMAFKTAPITLTPADMVTVTRCKDCKHSGASHRKNVKYLYCEVHGCWFPEDGYCHIGRQKENNTDGV